LGAQQAAVRPPRTQENRPRPAQHRQFASNDKDVRRAPRFIRTLVAARELVTKERRWTTIACAIGWDGQPEGGPFEEAVAFSFAGALMKAGGMLEPEFPVPDHVMEAMQAFLRTTGGKRWGDGVRYTEDVGHVGMLKAMDRTIARELSRIERSRGRR
jgi:hypothetical protein